MRVDDACCWWISQGGEGGKKRKGAKGWPDVRVETTGRIERNGDARKRKKKRRRIEGVTVDRRTAAAAAAAAARNEDGERCIRVRMDCSIVKCMNAVLEKSAIVSLTHGVVSRRSRHGLPKSSLSSLFTVFVKHSGPTLSPSS